MDAAAGAAEPESGGGDERVKCLIENIEVNYPCSRVCSLYGDCVTAFLEARKQQVRTNADSIRSMSDEELAEWLEYPICKYSKCAEVCPVFPENKDKSCKENILNYLRQPAEEVPK